MIAAHVEGVEELRDTLTRAHRLTKFPKSMFAVLGHTVAIQTRARFDAKKDPDGVDWAPYAVSTLERKLEEGVTPDLLVETKKLRRSIEVRARRGEGEVGTNVEYAPYHNDEGERSSLPRRQFLGVGSEDIGTLDDRLQTYVDFYIAGEIR